MRREAAVYDKERGDVRISSMRVTAKMTGKYLHRERDSPYIMANLDRGSDDDGTTTMSALRSDTDSLLAYVKDLHLNFRTDRGTVKALDGVNFDIHKGELLALVGETGCGKTVTARSFMQLVPTPPGHYTEGVARIRSESPCRECSGGGCDACHGTGEEFQDLLEMSDAEIEAVRGDKIAMIFQDPEATLNPSMTIRSHMRESILAHQGESVMREAGIDGEQLNQVSRSLVENYASADSSTLRSYLLSVPPLRQYKRDIRRVVRERSVDLLYQTQIANPEEVLDGYPHELSGGQQQRVMIAMALAAEPDLLIADEPTTALDVTTQSRILELLKDLMDEYDTGLLYITHDLNLVSDIADRVAVMYAGEIAEIGDVKQVYTNPLHPYTRGLINSIPSEERVGRQLREIDGSVPDLTRPPEGCRFCTRCPEELDYCSEEDPPIVEEEPGHRVACHLYPSDGLTDEQPLSGKQQRSELSSAEY